MPQTMRARRPLLTMLVGGAIAATAASDAHAARPPSVPSLHWTSCGALGASCTRARVPADYDQPHGPTYSLFVARSPATDPAHRIGVLFYNFGGPGAPAARALESGKGPLLPALNRRFDLIGMDPRGVGQSTPAIDCRVDQEKQGVYAQPFTRPATLDPAALLARDHAYVGRCLRRDGSLLRHVSTANVARDIDLLRRALGEPRISYLGYSYGTLLGATYANLFPRRYRAMVLDGPLDANAYLNDPQRNLAAQTDGFEDALRRFVAHTAQTMRGVDRELARLDRHPARAGGRTIDGDDARAGIADALYDRQEWSFLDSALRLARRGRPLELGFLADAAYDRAPGGGYGPANDAYFTIGAAEQRYPRGLDSYLRAGRRSYARHPHFWFNNGYSELVYRRYPARDHDAYRGPWRLPRSAAAPLVVATTHDPATPYAGARRLVRELHRARLLTMRGDGHTAYPGNSSCIDRAVEAALVAGTLPPAGTRCRQHVPTSLRALREWVR
jgi:pimeloyl-ACP methyl ester carboxylesterase